jgi:hypothetical protein
MSLRRLAPIVLLLAPLASSPAWADSADGTEGTDGADGGEDTADDTEDDKGCSHMATPVTGLSLIVGAALALGLRRR